MERINFEELERMEYWVGNDFVNVCREHLIEYLFKGLELNNIIKNGAKSYINIENKEKFISENLEECFEYIGEFSNNGHEINFDVNEIIYFTLDNIAECIKEYIDNGYKNEWDLL